MQVFFYFIPYVIKWIEIIFCKDLTSFWLPDLRVFRKNFFSDPSFLILRYKIEPFYLFDCNRMQTWRIAWTFSQELAPPLASSFILLTELTSLPMMSDNNSDRLAKLFIVFWTLLSVLISHLKLKENYFYKPSLLSMVSTHNTKQNRKF